MTLLASLQAAAAVPEVGSPADTAALRIANRTVVVFRGSLGAQSATERASAARLRVQAGLDQGDTAIAVVAGPQGQLVRLGDRPVFVVTAAEAVGGDSTAVAAVAADAAATLRVALADEAQARSTRALAGGVGMALLVTVLLWLGLRLVQRARVWLDRRIDQGLLGAGTGRLGGVLGILRRRGLLRVARGATAVASWVVIVVLLDLWVTAVLRAFPYTRPVGEALGGFVGETLRHFGLAVASALPGLATAVLILAATWAVAEVVKAVSQAVEQGQFSLPGVHADTLVPTRWLATAFVWLTGVALAYPYLPGADSAAFKGLSVLVGLVLSFGSSSLASQAMSGLALMYSRAFRVGDIVRVGATEGMVLKVGLLTTTVRDGGGQEVCIPNAVAIGSSIVNASRQAGPHQAVLTTGVTIGYDAPWRTVHQLLLDAARATPGLAAAPAPRVAQRELSDFYVDYRLIVHLEHGHDWLAVRTALHGAIQDAFNRAGLQIMSPHYRADPPAPLVVPPEQWGPDPR